MIKIGFLFCFYVTVVTATLGIDISQRTSLTIMNCLVRTQGFKFAVIRGYQSNGQVDSNVVNSVKLAWQAGFEHVDVYLFPCPKCSSKPKQLTELYNALKAASVPYGQIWLDIEGPQYWTTQTANRAFFEGLLQEAQELGLTAAGKLGIYTSLSQWNPIMGGAYTKGNKFPLWYAHYDSKKDFSDFSPFGGWTHPNIKQYAGDATVCNMGVDLNYYP